MTGATPASPKHLAWRLQRRRSVPPRPRSDRASRRAQIDHKGTRVVAQADESTRSIHRDVGKQYFCEDQLECVFSAFNVATKHDGILSIFLDFQQSFESMFYYRAVTLKRYLAVVLVNHNGGRFYLLHVIHPRIARCLHRYDALIFVKDGGQQLRGPSLDISRKNVVEGLLEFVVFRNRCASPCRRSRQNRQAQATHVASLSGDVAPKNSSSLARTTHNLVGACTALLPEKPVSCRCAHGVSVDADFYSEFSVVRRRLQRSPPHGAYRFSRAACLRPR